MKTKICTDPDCIFQGQPQPIQNFAKNKDGKDGLHSKCRKCKSRIQRARYHNDLEFKEKRNKQIQAYRSTEHGQKITKKCQDNYWTKHPNRKKARERVNDRVKNNKAWPKASKLSCAYCGNQAHQYHHHKGYSKKHWLDVIPLCVDCHNKVHTKNLPNAD